MLMLSGLKVQFFFFENFGQCNPPECGMLMIWGLRYNFVLVFCPFCGMLMLSGLKVKILQKEARK